MQSRSPAALIGALLAFAMFSWQSPAESGASPGAHAARCSPLTGSPTGRDPRGVAPSAPNPLAGLSFYVDPREPSYRDMLAYRSRGDKEKEELISRIALQPKFRWFGRFSGRGAAAGFVSRAQCDQPGSI